LDKRPAPPIDPLNVAVPDATLIVLVPATVIAFTALTVSPKAREVPPVIAKAPDPNPVLELREIAPAVRFVPPL
jgi:hypothetical protein